MNEEKRNLLYVCVKVLAVDIKSTEKALSELLQNLAEGPCAHLLTFRTKPTKVYLVWNDSLFYDGSVTCAVYISFTIRLKSVYDYDFIIPRLQEVKNVIDVETSWFPSRISYGGVVQEDGSIIESWDI